VAAQSLGKLACTFPELGFASIYIPSLVDAMVVSDAHLHGSLLSLGEIVLGLHRASSVLSLELKKTLSKLLGRLSQDNLESFGSDVVRQGACHFIQCAAQTDILQSLETPDQEAVCESWWAIIGQTLARSEEILHPVASEALKHFLLNPAVNMTDSRMQQYLDNTLPTKDKYTKRGFSIALGSVPKPLLLRHAEAVVNGLIQATYIQENNLYNDAEARRNAVHALIKVLETLTDTVVQGLHGRLTDARCQLSCPVPQGPRRSPPRNV
ncbi:hypothetical protein HDU91_004570, partial [Kappamyces sp. JEL0680]